MKKIVLFLFIYISTLVFAIPDFPNYIWGISPSEVAIDYPKLTKSFSVNDQVDKFSSPLKDSKFKSITFLFFQGKLYKIIKEVDPRNFKPMEVKDLYKNFSAKWGAAQGSPIHQKFKDFSIKGNKQIWEYGSTYISIIGEDYYNSKGKIIDSKLLIEYGLIDPKNYKSGKRFDDLLLQ